MRPLHAQFHPEFKSRPGKPSALFLGLILAAAGKLDNFLSNNYMLTASPLSPIRGPPARKIARLANGGVNGVYS